MATDLTKRRKFGENIIKGMAIRAAALAAGYSNGMVDHAMPKLGADARAAFRMSLDEHLPLGKIAAKVAEGADAFDTKFFQFEGKVTDTANVIAWGERREYLKLACNLLGISTERVEHTGADGEAIGVDVVAIGGRSTSQLQRDRAANARQYASTNALDVQPTPDATQEP
jgi:hypothetical protein